MKFCVSFLLICLGITKVWSQLPYGNEWINYGKRYWKITLDSNGIYRITFQDLIRVGFPVTATDPRNIKMFFRGKEIAINIVGQEDGVFNPNDFIEFYGMTNDGFMDAMLYNNNVDWNPNPYVNIYDNHTYYFLTTDDTPGKRIQISNFTSGLPVVAYHMREDLISNASAFAWGTLLLEAPDGICGGFPCFGYYGSVDANWISGKGYSSAPFPENEQPTWRFNLRRLYSGTDAPFPSLEVRVNGKNNSGLHHYQIFSSNDSINFTFISDGFVNNRENSVFRGNFSQRFSATDTAVFIRVSQVNLRTYTEYIAVGAIKIRYPQQLVQFGDTFRIYHIPAQSISNVNVEIDNTFNGLRGIDITDFWNVRFCNAFFSGGKTFMTLTNAQNPIKLAVTLPYKHRIKEIKEISFVPYNLADRDYLIISHRKLMQPVAGSLNPVQDYANYRASLAGGNFKPIVADVEQLYDQFAYGERHPMAIRQFCRLSLQVGNPKFLFLIGKSRNIANQATTRIFSSYSGNYAALWDEEMPNLVPTFGAPHCDNCYTANLRPSNPFEAIPTGRLTATTPAHVLSYLNKVREHESLELDNLWRKNVLHLSGGKVLVANEILRFRSYMQQLGNLIQGPFFGANFNLISRQTSGYIETFDISQEINEGLSIINLYGHNDITTPDVNIGNPADPTTEINNRGKYPLVIMNGCNSGNISEGIFSYGENWMLTPNKGSGLFVAHSALGIDPQLYQYSQSLYRNIFGDSTQISKPFGEAYAEAKRRYVNEFPSDGSRIAVVQQMVLQGDPAWKVFPFNRPDYKITDSDLFLRSFEKDGKLLATSDSFQIGLIISNLGITHHQPFYIQVRRTFGDGSVARYDSILCLPIAYKDTFFITIRQNAADKERAAGINSFSITLDYLNQIDEWNENNNTAQLINQRFLRASILPIFPPEFSIVNTRTVGLYALNQVNFAEARQYRIEIDTSHLWNSPLKKDTILTAVGSPSWIVSLPQVPDTTTFYWRVSYAELRNTDDTIAGKSSFTFIPNGPTGWSQNHFPQYKRNLLTDIIHDEASRKWKVLTEGIKIEIQAGGDSVPSFLRTTNLVQNRTFDFEIKDCDNGIIIARLDKETLRPLLMGSHNDQFSGVSCGAGNPGAVLSTRNLYPGILVNNFFDVHSNTNANPLTLQPGDYFIIMSKGRVDWTWYNEANMRNFFVSLGKIGVDSLFMLGLDRDYFQRLDANQIHFIIGKFNGRGKAGEVLLSQTVPYGFFNQAKGEIIINARSRVGTIKTPLIGPVEKWENAYRRFSAADNNGDKWKLDIIGVDNNGNETILKTDTFPQSEGKFINLADISVSQYPFLRLQATMEADSVNLTHYTLDKWQVYYSPIPEGILLVDSATTALASQLANRQEGDTMSLGFVFRNISSADFKQPIQVVYNLTNSNRTLIFTQTLPALKAGEEVRFRNPTLQTLGFLGDNILSVYVNSPDSSNPFRQTELFYGNNFLDFRYKVLPDQKNPILEVTFDGRYILDGEIVSPTPLIQIRLKDENKFRPLQDTSAVDIFLASIGKSDSIVFRKISFSDPRLSWQLDANNRLEISYRPERLSNGLYLLRVQGKDANGNRAGSSPYQVRFEVINESSVSYFYPYPNPFSTSVRFVFTLTGDEIPDEMKIQIMTVSGKVVKEITQSDIGPIHIGNNITHYAWDGKDEYGDQLANGVYLYRVLMRKNGQSLEHRSTAGDRFFERGWGKMYLLR
ncbi:MAG: C25 family cysteine peptidase [Cytophagales bacterium]|nr:C25 family cysteine peptidase [Cytophagales bacterium]MDW8383595.1 C25 family cysteine peptidase [Flammeovirgaceae bacterium]